MKKKPHYSDHYSKTHGKIIPKLYHRPERQLIHAAFVILRAVAVKNGREDEFTQLHRQALIETRNWNHRYNVPEASGIGIISFAKFVIVSKLIGRMKFGFRPHFNSDTYFTEPRAQLIACGLYGLMPKEFEDCKMENSDLLDTVHFFSETYLRSTENAPKQYRWQILHQNLQFFVGVIFGNKKHLILGPFQSRHHAGLYLVSTKNAYNEHHKPQLAPKRKRRKSREEIELAKVMAL